MKLKLIESSYTDTLKYRVNNDDDLIIIKKNGEVIDKGMVDYLKDNWNRFDDFRFDENRKLYVFNDGKDEYTMEKIIVESDDLKESFNPSGYTKAIQAISEGIENDEDIEALKQYLQNIIHYCKSLADDYNITVTLEEEIEESEGEATQPADIAKKEEYRKLVRPDFKVGTKLEESYNYIGRDTGEPGRDSNSHIEHVYTLYDELGEVDTFKSREAAEQYIEDHKDDPIYTEEYGYTNGPGFRIEEDDREVLNNKIVVKDDLI